jgi:tRNA-splicing ligase RtcB
MLRDKLLTAEINVKSGSMEGLAEEAPMAYKEIERVVVVVYSAGIAKKVARLKPCIVIKG